MSQPKPPTLAHVFKDFGGEMGVDMWSEIAIPYLDPDRAKEVWSHMVRTASVDAVVNELDKTSAQ